MLPRVRKLLNQLESYAKRHGIKKKELAKELGVVAQQLSDWLRNIIKEAPLPVWANLRQRALDTAMTEINKKTDLNIAIESLERSLHRRVTSLIFAIKTQEVPEQSD
jgi:transcriptional regulator with XRE-family HTH domain